MISVVRPLGDIPAAPAAQISSGAVHTTTVIMPTADVNSGHRLVTIPAFRALSNSPSCGDLRQYSKESSPCSSDNNYMSSGTGNGAHTPLGCESPTHMGRGGVGGNNNNGRPNRDPLSHRIIEKRRRDRMNNCLSHLSRLIPPSFTKKGRGRVEKTEIIEMAIRYMQHVHEEQRRLQQHIANAGIGMPAAAAAPAVQNGLDDATQSEPIDIDDTQECNNNSKDASTCTQEDQENTVETKPETAKLANDADSGLDGGSVQPPSESSPNESSSDSTKIRTNADDPKYRQGYFDCVAETLRFLAIAGGRLIDDGTKAQLLLHLQKYFGHVTHDSTNSTLAKLLYGEAKPTTFSDKNDIPIPPGKNAPQCPEDGSEELMDTRDEDNKATPGAHSLSSNWTVSHRSDQSSCGSQNNTGVKISHHPINAAGHLLGPMVDADQPLNMCIKRRAIEQYNNAAATTTLLTTASTSLYKLAAAKRLESSGSSHYPSSPSVGSNEEHSNQSLSGLSTNSQAADSPPRTLSPPSMAAAQPHGQPQAQRRVPAFALHASSMYYVPVMLPLGSLQDDTVNMLTAQQFNTGVFGMSGQHHPVTIPVNFNAAAAENAAAAAANNTANQPAAQPANQPNAFVNGIHRTCRSFVVNQAAIRQQGLTQTQNK